MSKTKKPKVKASIISPSIPKCAIIKQTKGEFTTIIKEAKL